MAKRRLVPRKHLGEIAIIALSRARPPGIDVERIDDKRPWPAIAERFFSPRECAYLNEAPTPDRFFEIWTKKEAYVKLTGEGILSAPTKLTVTDEIPSITFEAVNVAEGYKAALALPRSENPPTLQLIQLS
jgi:4'-phosphopantetheinyl transferase